MTTKPARTSVPCAPLGLLERPTPLHHPRMASSSDTQNLLEKIRGLPDEKIAEVVDFVDFLRARLGLAEGTREDRVQAAIDAGFVIPPKPGSRRTSPLELPPIAVAGTPASEMVIEDRR